MSKNFEWRSEEDEGWEETVGLPITAVAPRRHWYWVILLVFIIFGTVGVVLARHFNQQLATTTVAIETDILARHNLLRDAAYRRDVELFITGLSGRDPDWVDAQQRLVQEETFLARPALGFIQADGEFRAITAADLTLSADLATAEFSYEEQYRAANEDGQTVTLRQTAVYRRGRGNWLLIPPDATFWGESVTITGTHIIAQFPMRDTAVVQRLVQDLDVKIDELCHYPGLDCPQDLTLPVQFGTNLALLADLQDERVLWQDNVTRLHLPTPTLVGIPVDETGYALLWRGYANQVLTAVISDLVDYRCCQGQLYYRALLDKLLGDVGVRDWPLTAADYARLLDEGVTLNVALAQARQLWEMPLRAAMRQDEWPQAHALVAFALMAGIGSPAELTPNRFVDWLRPFSDNNPNFADSLLPPSGVWLQFVYQQAIPGLPSPPLPLPEQEVRLACLGAVYGYDLAQHELRVIEDGFSVEQMTPLADDSGLLLQGRSARGSQEMWQAVLWRHGQRMVLYERPYQLDGKIYAALLQGERVVVYAQDLTGDFWQGLTVTYFDVNACAVDGCGERPLSSVTGWSPDGQHTLVWQPGSVASSGQLAATAWLGDAAGQPQVEIGVDASFTAQWVDETHFLLMRPSADSPAEAELWLGSVETPVLQRLLTMTDVVAVLPAGAQAELMRITAVAPVPGRSDLLWIKLRGRDAIPYATVSYVTLNWQTGELAFQYQPQANFVDFDVYFSPDGVWAAQYISGDAPGGAGQPGGVVNVYNLQQQVNWNVRDVQPMLFLVDRSGDQAMDWSADGRWLLTSDENGFRLVAPDGQYDHHVITGYPGCTAAAWVNP